ncbi:hypothetical protein [Arachidicoccus terrestris]|uniref:hypothetical protein n=1 Tax=Arachidicoccus terrestris TaxID=2875539 RepID=UPI001CC6AFCE|nr:hypothetical protein [Arachidicoccus terrestris]UAY54272.1 hypothetical protein K9M52_12500 [Arachidicoccus terrestris]
MPKKLITNPLRKHPIVASGGLVIVVDKLVEAATGKNTNGAFQTMEEFAESVYNISQLKKPTASESAVETVDKVNVVVEFVDKAMKLINSLFNKTTPLNSKDNKDDKSKK